MKKILCLSILAIAGYASGQDCTQTVPISVLDQKSGLAVAPLSADALQARQGETVIPIKGIEEIHTRRLLVLVDESGSIAGGAGQAGWKTSPVRITLDALNDLVGNPAPGLSIEYGLFDDQWVFGDSFTPNPHDLREGIAHVNQHFAKIGHGQTAIFDVLHEALLRFTKPHSDDAILLFTDGEDSASKRSAKELEAEYRASGVRLFTILLKNKEPLPLQLAARDSLIALANRTGGSVYELDPGSPTWLFDKSSKSEVQRLHRFWDESVRSGYLLDIQLPPNFRKNGKWKLSIHRATAERLKNAALNYPDRLRPCSAALAAAH